MAKTREVYICSACGAQTLPDICQEFPRVQAGTTDKAYAAIKDPQEAGAYLRAKGAEWLKKNAADINDRAVQEYLLTAVNLGGLGTLIASMASLISYKQLALVLPRAKGRYIAMFTAWNAAFLAALLVLHMVLGG